MSTANPFYASRLQRASRRNKALDTAPPAPPEASRTGLESVSGFPERSNAAISRHGVEPPALATDPTPRLQETTVYQKTIDVHSSQALAHSPRYARLPRAPINTSPVPRLTSLYHLDEPGEYGDRRYPGNCGGNLIKDLLRYFRPARVFDPMTGSGTCRDVCRELRIECWSTDMHQGIDACDASQFPRESFDFCWVHPPYWRQKLYTDDSRDLSRTPTLTAFLDRYRLLIENCAGSLAPGGKLALLMGDYSDRDEGFVPLTYHTKRLAFECGLVPACTDIIRFSHGASSGRKVYRSAFIPGLHDVCMVFEKRR